MFLNNENNTNLSIFLDNSKKEFIINYTNKFDINSEIMLIIHADFYLRTDEQQVEPQR